MPANDQPQSRSLTLGQVSEWLNIAEGRVNLSATIRPDAEQQKALYRLAIAALSESAAMDTPKWTALSDKTLPPDGHDVLVYTATGLVKDESPMQVRSLWRARESGEACYYTHWMPTPKAPSGERQQLDKPV